MTRGIRSVAVAALAVGAALLSACALDQNLFNARRLDDYALSNAIIPDSLREEGAWLVGRDTVAWVFARRPGSTPRLTLLFCHGNKDNLAEYWPRVETLWQAGFDVLTFDYRGFGKSTGTSSEATMRADSEAALAALRARGVRDTALAIHGFSLGGVCAIHRAARAVTPRALIVEAAFTNAGDLVRTGTVLDVPGGWLMKDPYDNLAGIRLVTAPALVVHGDADTFLPFRFGEALHAAATGASPRALVRVSGANHTDIPERLGPAAYGTLLHGFAQSRGAVVSPR